MRHFFPGEDLGDMPLWQRRHLTNPFAGEKGPEHHGRCIESIVTKHRYPQGATKHEIGKARGLINFYRHNAPETPLFVLRQLLRTQENLPDAFFDTTLLQEQEIALADGYEVPAFQAHRQIIVEGEPFMDFRTIKFVRLTRPADLHVVESPRDVGEPDQIVEKDGPIVDPLFFQRTFGFDWETSTVRNVMNMLEFMYGTGEAAQRTLEKYVFVTNLSSNPTLQLDGTAGTSLLADHTTARGVNNIVDAGTPSATNMDTVVDQMKNAIIDNEPVAKSFGWVIARLGGAAYRQAIKTLDPDANRDPDNANNTINIYGPGREYPFRILPVDLTDWTGTAWYTTFDFRRSPMFGPQMRWYRGMNTPQITPLDEVNSRDAILTGSREYLIRLVGAMVWGDVVGVYRGAA